MGYKVYVPYKKFDSIQWGVVSYPSSGCAEYTKEQAAKLLERFGPDAYAMSDTDCFQLEPEC